MAKSKWTEAQLQEIFSNPIHTFPPPRNNRKRGPNPKFLPCFVNDPTIRNKFEGTDKECPLHKVIVDLLYGGAGGSKTTTSVGLGLGYAINFPGSIGLVGAKTHADVKNIVIKEYKKLLTINEEWDHPLVYKIPNDHNKELVLRIPLANGGFAYSTILFRHFKEWQRIRGVNIDWAHFEEISQMDDGSIIDELVRRIRGTVLPVRHIFCTTNPPEDFSHFLYDKWQVRQFQEGYEGPRLPLGKPCTCQFCQSCLNNFRGEWLFDGSGTCTNPECYEISQIGQKNTRDYYVLGNTKLFCPGNQEFWRVHFSNANDNPHLPADYFQTMKSSSDDETFELYSEGKIRELRGGHCYGSMSRKNINPYDIEIDYEKDLVFTLDANTKPQCSALIQEQVEETYDGIVLSRLDILDELIVSKTKRPNPLRPGAGPADVALEFMERYPDFKESWIWLWGDPNAWGNTQDPFQETAFQIIYNILTENGYKVKMGIKSAKGNNKFTVIDKVTNVNWLLEDHLGTRRLFINPKCEYTIMSLEENKWDPNGKAIKDKSADRLAYKALTDKKRPLTHITDAIDAFIAFKYNLIQRENFSWFQIPGEFTATIHNGKVKEHPVKKILEEQLKPRQVSLKDIVDTYINEYREEQDSFLGYFL